MSYSLIGVITKEEATQVIDDIRSLNLENTDWKFFIEKVLERKDLIAIDLLLRQYTQETFLDERDTIKSLDLGGYNGHVNGRFQWRNSPPQSLDLRISSAQSGREIVAKGFHYSTFDFIPVSVHGVTPTILSLASDSSISYTARMDGDFECNKVVLKYLSQQERERLFDYQTRVHEYMRSIPSFAIELVR